MRALLLYIALILLAPLGYAQNYIGVHKDAVRRFVPNDFAGFVLEYEGNANSRTFIKFVDAVQEQTLIFVFDPNDICVSMSRMYNTWYYDKLHKSLQLSYLYLGSNTWLDERNGQQYEIRLKRNNWFVTVVTRRHKPAEHPPKLTLTD